MIPAISVIIPAYNEEKYLPRCLTALTHQDFSLPYEIIVVNNYSTDKTKEIALSYCSSESRLSRDESRTIPIVIPASPASGGAKAGIYKINYIDSGSSAGMTNVASRCSRFNRDYSKNNFQVRVIFEKQKGVNFALKRGFIEAKSEIIAVTDADTIVPPNWLARIYQIYQSDQQIVGLSGGYDFDKKFWWRDFLKEINIFFFSFFRTFSGFNMSFKKRALLKVGGVNLKINLGTDVYISQVLKKVGKCLYLKHLRVVTSSRRYDKPNLFYLLNNFLTYLSLLIFKKTTFQHFRAIR